MGNPRGNFCHISFPLTSLNFQKGLRLQLQLNPPVLRWKRLPTSPLPHLLKWHHKLEEILLQFKLTDLQFIRNLHNWCALKYVFPQNFSTNSQSQTIRRGESSKKGTVYRENSTAMLHGLNSSLWHSLNYVKQMENEVTWSITYSNILSLPWVLPSGWSLAAQPTTYSK